MLELSEYSIIQHLQDGMTATEVDGRQRRAAERREETRERLLAAALEIFADQGYHAGTTKAIAQRAGVADGLLFHYFPTKVELMAAVAERSPLGPEIRSSIVAARGLPAAETLPRIARGWFQILREQRPLMRVLIEQAHADPRVHAALREHGERDAVLLAEYLAERIAAGELRAIDPLVAARMLFQSVFGLVMLCAAPSVADKADGAEEVMLDKQIDLLLHGMLVGHKVAPDAALATAHTDREER